DGPGLNHAHTIANTAGILLIMGFKLRHAPEHLVINGMHDLTLDRHDDRFIHLVADDAPDPLSPLDFAFSHTALPFAARMPSSAPALPHAAPFSLARSSALSFESAWDFPTGRFPAETAD